jgi:hypothetical protein
LSYMPKTGATCCGNRAIVRLTWAVSIVGDIRANNFQNVWWVWPITVRLMSVLWFCDGTHLDTDRMRTSLVVGLALTCCHIP